MAYIGQPPLQEFTSPPTKDTFTGDGSETEFDLAQEVVSGGEYALEVFIDNVRQEPGTGKAFTIGNDDSGDNKRITFTAAPANSAAIYVINDKTNLTAIAPTATDLNGVELILDADADTSITADTDDTIDIKIAGADDFQFTANTFTALSGSTIKANTIAETTAASGVTIDSVLLKDGVVTGTGFTIGSAAITEAELEILDGLASTTAELGVIDGDTSATSTTLADADRVVVNDNGTMVQVALTDFETYMETSLDTLSNVTTVGALDSGSITSGFGAIDNGTSNIRSATITAETAFVPDASGGADLGTTALEFNDAFFNDGAVINFGDDQDVTLTHNADTGLTLNSVMVATTFEPTGDTAAGDNAVIGYTAAEGLILTGQGSTSDITIKNDADADVFTVATGTTTGTFAGTVLAKTDTDASNTGSVTLDFTANQNFVLTLTGNVTLANPTTEQVGQSGFIAFIQDGTGSRTVSLGTDYETAAAAGLTLTSTASATDLVPYLVVASGRILLGTPQLAFA